MNWKLLATAMVGIMVFGSSDFEKQNKKINKQKIE